MLKLNLRPFPQLSTEHLTLRQMNANDENEILLLRSDEDVNKFLGRPKISSIHEARQFIDKISKAIEEDQSAYWAIAQAGSERLIGTICLWNFDRENYIAEIGYELMPAYQGRGLMQEAVAAVTGFGFKELRLKRIDAFTHKDNRRSSLLLEKFHFGRNAHEEEKLDRDGPEKDMIVYSLVNSE